MGSKTWCLSHMVLELQSKGFILSYQTRMLERLKLRDKCVFLRNIQVPQGNTSPFLAAYKNFYFNFFNFELYHNS